MLRRAATLWPTALEELNVPFLCAGGLMLARTGDEARRLTTEIAANCDRSRRSTELLDRGCRTGRRPVSRRRCHSRAFDPGEGVIDPFWLTRAYADAAISGGASCAWVER